MKFSKTALKILLVSCIILPAVQFHSCGARYMQKPKVIVEANNPQVSYYASVIALSRKGYKIKYLDETARSIITEPRVYGSYWVQFKIDVPANGNVVVEAVSNLEIESKEGTLVHRGNVNRAIDLSKHIRRVLIEMPPEKIVALGSSLIPSMTVTPETSIVVPGSI